MPMTYELGLKYELARELIGHRMSLISAELGRERAKPSPDPATISMLKAKSMALFMEREAIRSDNEAEVLQAIERYRLC